MVRNTRRKGDWKFPTDRLCLGELRDREPWALSSLLVLEAAGEVDCDALAAIRLQNILVDKAEAICDRRPDPSPEISRDGAIAALDGYYRTYGLVSSYEDTKKLVREFENKSRSSGHGR
jgi:hypothetical protein